MKKIILIPAATLMILSAVAILAFKSPEPRKKQIDITGTWQLDSYKYGTMAGSFTPVPFGRPHIKLITSNRFMWMTYDSTSKKILESAGGKYALNGDAYTESIDYGYGMDSYLGSTSTFRIQVDEDLIFLTGTLGTGLKIEEVWKKIN